jgi:hypothetical protein
VEYVAKLEKYEPKENQLKTIRDRLVRAKKRTFEIPEKKLTRE